METRVVGRGAMTSDDVLAFMAGNRRYGVPDLLTDAIFDQPIPEGFNPLMLDLRGQLQLPKLPPGSGRSAIYAAYSLDITLINSCRDDFVAFINAGVRASLVSNQRITIDGKMVSVGDYLINLPPMANESLVTFTAEIAAWAESELLPHLQREIYEAVTKLFRIVCLWLDALATREFVGLITVTGPDTGRYHYFRPIRTEKVLEKKDGAPERVAFDWRKPYGSRTTYEQDSELLIEVTHDLERHDHDIVAMRVHSIEDYPDAMPMRIARFLEQTPAFIRRHLCIVSGSIIRERVVKRTVSVEQESKLETSTWLDSPAVTLAGVYVPIGWNGRDMEKELTQFFSGQKSYPKPPSRLMKILRRMRHYPLKTAKWGLAVFGALAVSLLFAWSTTAGFVVATIIIVVVCILRAGDWIEEHLD